MIKDEFNWIRQNFFPRWDRKELWHVTSERPKDYLVDMDLCDWEEKRIHICSDSSGDELRVILIHEITHAVVPHSTMHGHKWQKRMIKASLRAKQLGEHRLAKMIKLDVEAYNTNPETVTASLIYSGIKDILIDIPDKTFEQVKEMLCIRYPMKLQDFDKRYKIARRKFKEEQEWASVYAMQKSTR